MSVSLSYEKSVEVQDGINYAHALLLGIQYPPDTASAAPTYPHCTTPALCIFDSGMIRLVWAGENADSEENRVLAIAEFQGVRMIAVECDHFDCVETLKDRCPTIDDLRNALAWFELHREDEAPH